MILITLAFLLIIVFLIKYQLDFWKRKGVPYAKTWSPFGNIWENILQRKSMQYILQDMYNQFPDEPFFGMMTFLTPTLVIRDPELYRELAVKTTDVFLVHKLFSTHLKTQTFSKNLFASDATTWKVVRPSLSPAFTGSKMRAMFALVWQCGQQWQDQFEKEMTGDVTTVNMKEDITLKFTVDVIANCIFGLESNSFKNKKNEFYKRGKNASSLGGTKVFALLGYCLNQFILKLFKLKVIDEEDETYFRNTVLSSIKFRNENKVIRPDMLNLLMEAQKGKVKYEKEATLDNTGFATIADGAMHKPTSNIVITDTDIVAHSILLLIAGSDTPACNITFLMYEIATHKDIQQKIYDEIHEAMEECGGNLTYEKLIGLKYLDMVCSEGLRKWPPIPMSDRAASKPYTINFQGKSVHLEQNSIIWVPTMCIHHDEKYYPDPEKFDPERFSDENREKISKASYIPFGTGPRACLGSRLGILMIKSIVARIVHNFEMMPVENTPKEPELSRRHIFINNQTPVYVGFRKRRV